MQHKTLVGSAILFFAGAIALVATLFGPASFGPGEPRSAEAALDITGKWAMLFDGGATDTCSFTVVQTGTALTATGSCPVLGAVSLAGTITKATGAFTLNGTAGVLTVTSSGTALSSTMSGAYTTSLPSSGVFTGTRGPHCGDLDGNAIVEVIDLILVSDHYSPGGGPPYVKQADLNKDGVVDLFNDILGVLSEFGTSAVCQTNTPLPKTTPTGGALAVDAQGESTSLSDTVETKRAVAVGVPFEVSVHVTSNPGTISGYGLRLHWDEALLELTPRTSSDNDRWKENVGGESVQVLGPSDDGAGSEAYIELGGWNVLPTSPTWSGTGPTAQFQFTCQAIGTANITLTDAGSHSVLLARPGIEYTPTLANAQINCSGGPTPTDTPTPTSTVTPTVTATGTPPTPTFTPTPITPTSTPVDTPTPTVTPTSAPTSTPTPGGPVDISGLWFFELTGDASLLIEAVVDQTGSDTSSAGTKWSMTGSIDLSRNWKSSGTLSFGCLGISTTGTAAVDGNSVTGTWNCDAFSGSYTGFKDLDSDGIAFDIDDNPSVGGNSFSDVPLSGTTSGSIDNRNGLSVFVRDSAVEAGVRVTAIGLAGQASLTLCSDPAVKLLNVQASTSVDVSCGSATINVEGSPVTVQLGSVLATLPTDSKATANVTAPGVIAVTNSAGSSGNIIVGGVSIAPAVTEAGIADTDGDGLTDAVETDTGTYVGPGDTGTDPANSDTDGDGLSDGLEVMLYSSDVFDIDTDNDGCRDGTEVGTDVDKGGLRDPTNPWDFYDINGDRSIDLFVDILGVIQHYSLDTSPPYDAIFDRGPSAGPYTWSMTAPDGSIDLFIDILGVIKQYSLEGCT